MFVVVGVFVRHMLDVQVAFVAEDVTSIIKESIDAVLQNQQYNHFKVELHIEQRFKSVSIYSHHSGFLCRLVSGLPPVSKLVSSDWLTSTSLSNT